jgi:hypothetical protein
MKERRREDKKELKEVEEGKDKKQYKQAREEIMQGTAVTESGVRRRE